ncbi:MAG: hypothetical protein JOZ57_10335 [Abitibacteriaceae bacterium]|nr:hypothetical protein [Abditibacteriaceae bacterium]
MNKLLNMLQTQDFTLMVSLPRNEVCLAQAALRGGAQGLKIHLNVHHFASDTHFGSLEEERANIIRILEVAGEVPVGVVPGGAPFATEPEFAELARMGVDFFDAYPAETPAWALTQNHLSSMLAAFEGASLTTMAALEHLGMEMCEASIVNHAAYGCALDTLDLAHYAELVQAINVPVIVPSQKLIVPEDIPALRRTGVKGLLIGAIVTGKEAASIEGATRAFQEVCASKSA